MGSDMRKGILDEASQYVTQDRNASYGEPEDNFGAIAAVWHAQGFRKFDKHGVPVAINATDVALMLAGMKLARLKTNPSHRDSWVDLAGYAACGADTTLSLVDTESQPIGGWVSNNRCGEKLTAKDFDRFGTKVHGGHSYGDYGGFFHPYWCDGYRDAEPSRKLNMNEDGTYRLD